MSGASVCFCTLAIHAPYRRRARLLCADTAPAPWVVLTDEPSDFADLPVRAIRAKVECWPLDPAIQSRHQKGATMTDYLLLYSGGSMPETEEAQAAVMKAWTDWMGQLGDGLKDGGNPFTPAAKTIGSDGSVRDGGPAPLTGYTVLTAGSLDEAAVLAKGSPVLQGGGSVSVHETFEM